MFLLRVFLVVFIFVLAGLTLWAWWVVVGRYGYDISHGGWTILVALMVLVCMTLWVLSAIRTFRTNLRADLQAEEGLRLVFSPEPEEMRAADPGPNGYRLIGLVRELTDIAGLTDLPRVYVSDVGAAYGSAGGISSRRYFVTISASALTQFDDQELRGLVAHEIAHLTQCDSLTLILIGVAFDGILKIPGVLAKSVKYMLAVMAIPLVIGGAVKLYVGGTVGRSELAEAGLFYGAVLITPWILTMILGWPAAAVHRAIEYRADAIAAELTSSQTILASLRAIKRISPDEFSDERSAYDTVPTYRELTEALEALESPGR